MSRTIALDDKLKKLNGIAKRLEQHGATFEQIRMIVLVEAERMNIRPVGGGSC